MVVAAAAAGPVGWSSVDAGRAGRVIVIVVIVTLLVFFVFFGVGLPEIADGHVYIFPNFDRCPLKTSSPAASGRSCDGEGDHDDGRRSSLDLFPVFCSCFRPVLACAMSAGAGVCAFGPSPVLQQGSSLV